MNTLLDQGLSAHREGCFQEAESAYRKALAAGGERDAEALRLYGTLLLQLGRLPEAIDYLRRSAAVDPNDYRLWLNLGEALRLAGQSVEAGNAAKQALLLAPGHPSAHLLQGNLDRAAGFPLDALRHYRRAINGNPALEAAWVNSTSLLLELGKAAEALDEAKAGDTVCPSVQLKKLLGRAHFAAGKTAEAIQAFVQAGDVESLVMAALIYHNEGKSKLAHDYLGQALSLDPNSEIALHNRASVFRDQGRLNEALNDITDNLDRHPDYWPALFTRARIYRSQGKLDAALDDLERCLSYAPEDRQVLGFAAELMPLAGDFATQEESKRRLIALGVKEGELGATPFEMLCLVDDGELLLATARNAARPLPSVAPAPRAAHGGERLVIGYLSSDFVDHALSRVMACTFEQHDRNNFKIIAYATRPDDGSEISRRIRGAVAVVRDVAGLPSQEIAKLIVGDQVDILVDLNGHTSGSMLGVLGYRPAPVQATYMGYPGTTGYAAVDYLIGDAYVIPAELERYYSETVVRLPHCYWAPDDKPDQPEPLSRKDCGLPEQGFVFACFNRANKFSTEIINTWLAILADVPDSVFWIAAEHPRLQAALRSMASAAGVSPDRLIFAAPAPIRRYLGQLSLVDLFLDTYPYNAHTLAFDALRLGTPILTLCGQSFAARVAGSMLHALQLPELITHDKAAYRERAISLARDPLLLGALRQRLQEVRRTSPVFDVAEFTRHLENAYRLMWQRALEGKAPSAISVPQ